MFNYAYAIMPEIMNVEEASEVLNITKSKCLKLLNTNELRGFKVNNSRAWKIPKLALEIFIRDKLKDAS